MSRYFRGRSEAWLNDFWISSNVSVLENREAVEVVSIVPLRYPTPHAKLGFWIYPTREMLDAIEAGLEGPSAGVRIVQCHFPVNLWSRTTRSKSGRTIGEILARGNVSLVLTGHLHPERPMFLHTDGVLEVVGPDLRWHERFGMVTVDNGRVVYHEVPLGETPFAVVSHPVPRTQLSTATAFAEQATEVRVIVFSGREDLSIFVSGAVNDRLNFTAKIAENVSLYTCPLEAMKRSTPYKLTFSGDWKSEMEFSIADYVSDLPDEAIYGFQNWQITAYVALGGLFTFLLVITFPFGRLEFAEQCAAWIAERSSEPHWFVAVCCGFLVTRERLRRAPAFLRAALFVATLWTACGPLIFIKIENLFGMIWIWGFLVDGIQHYDFYGPVFAAIYLATIVLPLVSATSQFGFRQWELIFIADYLVLATGIGGSIAVGYIWVVSAAGLLGVLTSPAYIIAPICLIVLFVIGMIKKRKELPATLSGIWSDLNSGPNQ
jgi:hypothetical protein